ncbi:UNVERIFIED_CONTAM: Sphingolipid delta(4)-desaturase DES1-like [Sesamum angustifolium]|uniref:Sphingolipid delta(4)-desaturase DES1-like n=1 Tax=Sesamum angustifolium TaxID=2727405 RepID=A0AAW2PB52_9LAMI
MGTEKESGEVEGVMGTDFFWSYTDEPHASRRRQILSQYPQIRQLFGPDPFAFLKITAVVLLQLWTATFLYNASWLYILIVAYFFGSFLNHNLFLAIHELSHNLAFSTPVYNRWLGIFANLPIGVPMSVTFQKYHLEHHRFQGVDGVDMDVPSLAEAKLSFGYLILSTFVGGGMHPMAGHFISEHYVFSPDQETYSYYGPLNLMTWSVGYHNEHHDFPRIPGAASHRLRRAPEFSTIWIRIDLGAGHLHVYHGQNNWSFSRMKRNISNKVDEN